MTAKLMSPEYVEAGVILAHNWANYWLREQPDVESGHALLRHMLMETALTPATSVADADVAEGEAVVVDFNDLPMFGGEECAPADYDDGKGHELVKKAISGDSDADAALCGIALKYVLFGKEMPSHLCGYIAAVLINRFNACPRRRKGGDRYANIGRNLFIIAAVSRLQGLGFKPTRNRATRTQRSGCSIVSEALSRMGFAINESGVEKVWSERSHYYVRD